MQTNLSIIRWIQSFVPHTVTVTRTERLRACLGALIGLTVSSMAIHVLPGYRLALPLLVAPMGASAVLLFAVPSSPLAQPWSVIGGNLVAATVGVTGAALISDPGLAGAASVAVTIALMFALRCVHPPSGAVALTAVFGGPAIHSLGYHFVASPIALQSVLLVCMALAYHAITGHRYPHALKPLTSQATQQSRTGHAGFVREDMEAVLKRRGEMLDIDLDDLEDLLRETQLQACSRSFKGLLCEDIMSGPAIAVTKDTSTLAALRLLQRHAVKALPVIDQDHRLQGIVTRADLVAQTHSGFSVGLAAATIHWFKRRSRARQNVGAIMTTAVCSVRAQAAMTDLLPLFAHSGHHHIPVLNARDKVVGMITESDVIVGLYSRSAGRESRAA